MNHAESIQEEKRSASLWLKAHISDLAAFSGLAVCLIFFTIVTSLRGESIWTASKVSTLISNIIVTALMSVGAVFVYAMGNMDVSIGKQVGLYATLMVVMGNLTGSLIPGILIALLISVVLGILNGASGEILHIHPVVSSVVVMMILSGVSTMMYSSFGSRNIALRSINNRIFKSPVLMVIVLLLEVLVITYFFNYTKYGKYARALGANQTATQQSGVNVIKFKVFAYVFMGVCVVIAALFQMGYTGAASDSTGTGLEMNVMVALILGGMPLSGGMRSKISCALIGAFTFSVLDVGLPLIGVPTKMTFMVKAIIFLVVVLVTCRKKDGVLPR